MLLRPPNLPHYTPLLSSSIIQKHRTDCGLKNINFPDYTSTLLYMYIILFLATTYSVSERKFNLIDLLLYI